MRRSLLPSACMSLSEVAISPGIAVVMSGQVVLSLPLGNVCTERATSTGSSLLCQFIRHALRGMGLSPFFICCRAPEDAELR